MNFEQEQKLIVAALEGVKNGLTKTGSDDDSRYGASVLTDKGNIYSSGTYFSNTLNLNLHAEQGALAHAAAHGEYGIVAIAVAGNDVAHARNHEQPIYPCHICKQLIWESYLRTKIDTEILIIKNNVITERLFIKNIMNYTWPQ